MCPMCVVGQNTFIGIYGVYTVFWQGNHQIYGHIRCIYTVLANSTYVCVFLSICTQDAALEFEHILW